MTGTPSTSARRCGSPMTPAISMPGGARGVDDDLRVPARSDYEQPHESSWSLRGGVVAAERFHRRVSGGRDAFSAKDRRDRHDEDAQVEQERPVVHVPDVHLEALVPRDGVSAVDLRPSGDSRADLVPASLLGIVARQVLHEQRPRPHDAHLAEKDVDELGQLVERGRAQDAAEAGEALGVGADRVDGAACPARRRASSGTCRR